MVSLENQDNSCPGGLCHVCGIILKLRHRNNCTDVTQATLEKGSIHFGSVFVVCVCVCACFACFFSAEGPRKGNTSLNMPEQEHGKRHATLSALLDHVWHVPLISEKFKLTQARRSPKGSLEISRRCLRTVWGERKD